MPREMHYHFFEICVFRIFRPHNGFFSTFLTVYDSEFPGPSVSISENPAALSPSIMLQLLYEDGVIVSNNM